MFCLSNPVDIEVTQANLSDLVVNLEIITHFNMTNEMYLYIENLGKWLSLDIYIYLIELIFICILNLLSGSCIILSLK